MDCFHLRMVEIIGTPLSENDFHYCLLTSKSVFLCVVFLYACLFIFLGLLKD